MQALDILVAVRAKIADEKNWTQHVSARNKDGYSVDPASPEACQWCIIGALRAVSENTPERRKAVKVLQAKCASWVSDKLSFFNDRATHPVVLDRIDKAIKELS